MHILNELFCHTFIFEGSLSVSCNSAHKGMFNHFKYPFHAGTDRETSLSHWYQGGESKWNPAPPACLSLLFPSYTTEGSLGWNQVRKRELHTSFPSKGQGTSRRERSQRVPEPRDRLCPPAPPVPIPVRHLCSRTSGSAGTRGQARTRL